MDVGIKLKWFMAKRPSYLLREGTPHTGRLETMKDITDARAPEKVSGATWPLLVSLQKAQALKSCNLSVPTGSVLLSQILSTSIFPTSAVRRINPTLWGGGAPKCLICGRHRGNVSFRPLLFSSLSLLHFCYLLSASFG